MKQTPFLKLILISCLLFLGACSKETPEPDEPYIGDGYIRGNFGSEYLNYTAPIITYPGGDTTANSYDPHINGGQLVMIRKGENSDNRSWQLEILGIDLDKMPVPIEFSSSQPHRSNQGSPTYGGMGLTDYSMPADIVWGGPEDSYNYWGGTSNDVTIRVISKKNDIVRGTFEGKVRTPSGLVKEVKDGEFMIKIIRVK